MSSFWIIHAGLKVVAMVTNKARVCCNVMEFLVAEEIEKQLKFVPARLAKYLNVQEISAFALNRLPALYATSERGWRQQCIKGKRDYGEKIKHAVR
ncbi:MAG: late competence development ComFB family protein, partial [Cyanobacteria bacterium]|nr:late competence development ComFB family protein [Cyanobacteriota bacterium]